VRDMARIGYLMLREGNWNGRQIVPRAWVRESTRAITPVHEMNPERRRSGPWGYGYLWWIWDGPETPAAYQGAYTGLGAVGQHIAVLPALDMVVVHKTVPGGQSTSHEQFVRLLELIVGARCAGECARRSGFDGRFSERETERETETMGATRLPLLLRVPTYAGWGTPAAVGCGSQSVNAAPLPGSLSTVSSPLIIAARLRLIARPRPVPPCGRV
jgi:hypothetical protein